jgi:hypothetical protein
MLGEFERIAGAGKSADMAKTQTLEAGLVGWRERFAEKIEKPVTKRTPLNGKQLRAILGALFFVNSALYVGRAISRAIRRR